MSTRTKPAPTERQIAFLQKLLDERPSVRDGLYFDTMSASAAAVVAPHDRKWVSGLIDSLLSTKPEVGAKAEAERAFVAHTERADAPVEVGMYRRDGDIFKVQKSKSSGRLYAKRLVQIGGKRLTEPGEVVQFEFQYESGAIFRLSAADKLSLEEAQQFGIQYGVCCVCSATLKDAQSVELGIGPVCRRRYWS